MSTIPKPDPSHPLGDGERPAVERALAIARRNWLILLVSIVVVPAVALAISLLQTEKYTATATLLFGSSNLSQSLFPESVPTDTDPQREAATNLRLVSLERIAARTAAALDDPGVTTDVVSEKIEVNPQGESDLISIEATDESPQFAATLANDFAEQYIDFRRESDRTKIVKAQRLVEEQLLELTPQEREGAEGQELEQRQRELAILSTLETGNAELVQEAAEPTSPTYPKTQRNLALGILIGMVLGICLALLREQLDRRLREPEDVADLLGMPVVGTIPESDAIQQSSRGTALPPIGAEGEAFRMLRAGLRYFNVGREITTALVTSAISQDGKTTVAWNLALAEASAGTKTLYIEADLRRPGLAEQIHLPHTAGLGELLAGDGDPSEAIEHVRGVDVLPAGPPPPNPAELIESRRMGDLLSWATENYDRVIIDTPPGSVVADAVALFNKVDGILVVVRLRKTPRDAVERLRDQLAHTAAPVLGIVINGVGSPVDSDYYRTPTPPAQQSNGYGDPSRSRSRRRSAPGSRDS